MRRQRIRQGVLLAALEANPNDAAFAGVLAELNDAEATALMVFTAERIMQTWQVASATALARSRRRKFRRLLARQPAGDVREVRQAYEGLKKIFGGTRPRDKETALTVALHDAGLTLSQVAAVLDARFGRCAYHTKRALQARIHRARKP